MNKTIHATLPRRVERHKAYAKFHALMAAWLIVTVLDTRENWKVVVLLAGLAVFAWLLHFSAAFIRDVRRYDDALAELRQKADEYFRSPLAGHNAKLTNGLKMLLNEADAYGNRRRTE